jgi:uncharacterized protein
MSERTEYPVGVPCWVDALRADPASAVAFYAAVFDWEADDRSGSSSSDPYYVCTLRGRDVAGIGPRPAADIAPWWNTYVRVGSVDAATATAVDAGGRVVLGPYASHDGGRHAIVADPAGATIGMWELGTHGGAQLVNEPSAWAMSVLNTAAVDEATRFYGAVFGWTTSVFDAGGAELTMWHRPDYVGGEPSQPVPRDVVAVLAPLPDSDAAAGWSINLWVHDADEVVARAIEHGGTVVSSPADRPPFREAVIADPEGAAVSISQLTTG